MNLMNGLETNNLGFIFALVLSFLVSGISWLLLRRKRLI